MNNDFDEFSETGQYLGTMPTAAEAAEVESQGAGRQWIGVYVDNDADAALVLEALRRLKEGGPTVRTFNQDFAGIKSLDWDNFDSCEDDESTMEEGWTAKDNPRKGQS